MTETRTFVFTLAQGEDGIDGLAKELARIATELPDHSITSFDYRRKGHLLHEVCITVEVDRATAAA